MWRREPCLRGERWERSPRRLGSRRRDKLVNCPRPPTSQFPRLLPTGLPKTVGNRSNHAAGIVRPAHGCTITVPGPAATMAHALPSHAAPTVRLELRHGSARSVVYDVPGEEFVLGSAPGCDLRLPGTNLPPV